MANTLTGLIPTIYEGLDIVSRELTGFIPSVARDVSAERIGKDQTITIPITPASSAADITPATTAPDTGDQTLGNTTMTLDKARAVPVRWNGEQTKAYGTNGTYNKTLADQFAQAFRTLANEIEANIAQEYVKASRAFGTSGTTPFATDLSAASNLKKILDDNGAPPNDRTLVINTTAGVSLRNLTGLNQTNTAGTDVTLRQGVLLPIMGMDVRESGQIQTHTKGTATGFDCTAVEPIGETTIACDGSDSGTILAGDVLVNTTLGDGIKYVVYSGSTLTGNASGNFIINAPGLLAATTIADEWTIQGNYTANLAFHRNAIQLATRAPAMPEGGDMSDDVMIVTDPNTGISFEIAVYRQYRQVHYSVGIVWGVSMIKPEHCAILLG